MNRLRIWVLGLALLPSVLQARTEPAIKAIDLAAAARALYTTAAGATPVVSLVRTIERYSDGFQYDTYEVRDPQGKPIGRLTRLQVFPDATSQIDLAIRLEGGKVAAVHPLRPLLVKGKPFKGLTGLFSSLDHRPAKDYSWGLYRFFGALGSLARADAGPPEPPKPLPAGTPPLVTLTQPELALGEPMPKFEALDLAGQKLTEAHFAGTPTVVIVASLDDGQSRDMIAAAAPVLQATPGVRVLVLLSDPPETLQARRGSLGEREWVLNYAALDPQGKARKAFKAPIIPYVYHFGPDGKLSMKTLWRGVDALAADLAAAGKAKP